MAELKHWEDFETGQVFTYGPHEVTREEIIDFARQFDPQPFHLSEDFAASSLLGGLSASGWHTCAIWMRMFVDDWASKSASLGAPGVDSVRWLKPVMVNDVLTGRSEILKHRISKSRPWLGLSEMEHECRNQNDEIVMTMRSTQMTRVRGSKG